MTDPGLIELARVAAGLTQGSLAKLLDVTQPFVSQVERGERQLPADLVPQWADACDVPTCFFDRPDRPPTPGLATAVHRRMKTLPAKPFHRANARSGMIWLEVDALFGEVEVVPAVELPELPLHVGPSDAAEAVRRAWRVPSGPLPDLVGLIESSGVPVVLQDSFHEKHSATSLRGRTFEWLIVLNANHPASRRRFTLAHELGHIVLRHDASVIGEPAEAARMEAEADAFASSLLMPELDARRELKALDFKRAVQLKQRWRVSIAFLVRQASDHGLIDQRKRQWLEIQLSRQPGGRRREPGEFEEERPQLLRTMIRTLESESWSLAEVAGLMTTDEDTLRSRYLGERRSLRPVRAPAERTVLRLDFPAP